MTDITPDFNVELKQRNATPVLAHRYSIDRLDEFLKEAYTIVCQPVSQYTTRTDVTHRMPGSLI